MPEVTTAELREAIDQIGHAFDEFKRTNDQRLEAIKNNRATSEFDEKLEKLQETMDRAEKTQKAWERERQKAEEKVAAEQVAWRQEQEEHARKVEARINRLALGLGGGVDEKNPQLALQKKAFDKYVRGREALSAEEVKVLSFGSDTAGGYLGTPATFNTDVIKAEVLFSPVRDVVTVQPMSAAEYQQPKRTGTASATRVSETQTRSETTNPTFGLVKISAPEAYAEARVTLMQLEDSAVDMEALLRNEFAEQFAVLAGGEVVSGNGVGKCLGFLDANAAGPSTPIAYTPSGSAAAIAGASGTEGNGLVNLFHAVKTAYAVRGRWVLNRGSLGKVRLIKDTTGQYLWQPGLVPGNPNSILSAPYTEFPDMPDEGSNTFPIAFGDFKRAYVMAERIDLQVMRDPYSVPGQVKFTGRRRFGGQVVLGEAIRLLKCATS